MGFWHANYSVKTIIEIYKFQRFRKHAFLVLYTKFMKISIKQNLF